MFVSLVYAAAALLFHRSFVYASPLVPRAGQGVWNPHITAPNAADVWTVGSTQFVTWDTSDIPPSAMDSTGTLLLGYFDGGTHNEHLDTREFGTSIWFSSLISYPQNVPSQVVFFSPTAA